MIGLHLAFNKKILQLVQCTYFYEEEETVVKVGNYSVVLVFESERIVGKVAIETAAKRCLIGPLLLSQTTGEGHVVAAMMTLLFF